MANRTDLASEAEALVGGAPPGVEQKITQKQGVRISKIDVQDTRGAEAVGKPIGCYVTLETKRLLSPEQLAPEQQLLAEQLTPMLPKEGAVLIIGLGNETITPDAVGPKTADGILATRHFKGRLADSLGLSSLRPVAVAAPGVMGQTGMEAAEIIQALCKQIQPEAVVAVDALAARSPDRLGTTVQICDTGIAPGSGVENARQELSTATLGVPVIAIGVPTVVDMDAIAAELCMGTLSPSASSMMVTPRDIDRLVAKSALLISGGLNRCLFPQLSSEELQALTGDV